MRITITKEFISKTTFYVIPACRESFQKKDCGQAAMTKTSLQCRFTYELISNYKRVNPYIV